MALEEYSGGRKRRKRSVLSARSVRPRSTTRTSRRRVVASSRPRRRVARHTGGSTYSSYTTVSGGAKRARRVGVRRATLRPSRLAAKRSADTIKRRYGRTKGKPRGDVSGAKFVGKRIREETAKKGRKLTRPELSRLFKDAWAEYKARKGK